MEKQTNKFYLAALALAVSLSLWGCNAVGHIAPAERTATETPVSALSMTAASADAGSLYDYEGDGAITLSVSFEPADVTNKNLEWFVSWQNPGSAWASGKSAASYIRLTSNSPFTSAGVKLLQAFSEPITVTATAEADRTKKASCTVDYLQRISAQRLTVSNAPSGGTKRNTLDPNGFCTVDGSPVELTMDYTYSSVYTKAAQPVFRLTYKLSEKFMYYAKAQGLNLYFQNRYSGVVDSFQMAFDRAFFSGFVGVYNYSFTDTEWTKFKAAMKACASAFGAGANPNPSIDGTWAYGAIQIEVQSYNGDFYADAFTNSTGTDTFYLDLKPTFFDVNPSGISMRDSSAVL